MDEKKAERKMWKEIANEKVRINGVLWISVDI